ncbi:four-carbon acid sugar kinase family protein [Bosea vestrisii]|uniref:four-carbon acid sugar kinase family protein n=1 Tax=Bosea vestrisii TaxID=151416 RepID=UPI0024DF3237|nr:four-carbon acid sugar kinase family protein [Bosea vestrisii]WID94701.1 four-carbon acid sugar kinase family protein [Bosea vestrisii]
MAEAGPRYGWYGDDFTGATDTLATLAEAGQRALLFLRIPTAGQLASAGPLDAVGIAGATRAMPPEAMARELDKAGRFFAKLGISLLHYKCCSTFDSAPGIGSFGAAARALRPHFPNPLLPVIGGQPNLGRYCLFGNLFAAAGAGGSVHRIDRHPTMSVHPVTPMGEADLRRHLAAQGLERVALVDYRSHESHGAGSALDTALAAQPDAVLFDVSRPSDLAAIGTLLREHMMAGPMLAIGPSSVAQAFAGFPRAEQAAMPKLPRPVSGGNLLALVGSLSPVTRVQVENASSYQMLAIDPARLIGEPAYLDALRREALAGLAERNVMLITDKPAGAPAETGKVAASTGALLRAIMKEARIVRLVVAGGDTSTLAIRALDLWGLSYRSPCTPGAPLCRAHSDDPRLDGLDIVLKGGQMGTPDFFNRVAETG